MLDVWGTPLVTDRQPEKHPFTPTLCFLLVNQSSIHAKEEEEEMGKEKEEEADASNTFLFWLG